MHYASEYLNTMERWYLHTRKGWLQSTSKSYGPKCRRLFLCNEVPFLCSSRLFALEINHGSNNEDKGCTVGYKLDYALLQILVYTAITDRKLSKAFTCPGTEDDIREKNMDEASDIIVSALSENSLLVFRTVLCGPAAITAKQYERFDLRPAASIKRLCWHYRSDQNCFL